MPERPKFHFDVDVYLHPFVPSSRIHLLPGPIARFLGHRHPSTPQKLVGSLLIAGWAFLGAFISLIILEAIFQTKAFSSRGTPIIIGSLGASAILKYNAIDGPLSQPRSIFFGQLFSSFIGICIAKLFQLSPHFESIRWIGGAIAVGLASAIMTLTKTVHPPAGATALLAVTSSDVGDMGWFLIPVILLACTIMIIIACIINNVQRQYPVYWFAPHSTPLHHSPHENAQEKARNTDGSVTATTTACGTVADPDTEAEPDSDSEDIDTDVDGKRSMSLSSKDKLKREELENTTSQASTSVRDITDPYHIRITHAGTVIPEDFPISDSERAVLESISYRIANRVC